MRNCELCKREARTHCESDQAYLCWSCDFKVHSANFLVARHSRTLLCRACQSPTPWTAAGSSFGPTLSVCRDCFVSYKFTAADDEESRAENEIVEEEEEEEEVGNSDEEDVDIQVVPWSPSTPPPNSEGEGEGESESCRSSSSSSSPTRFGAKRKRKHEVDTDIRLNGVSYLDTVADGGSGRGKIMRVGSLEETRLTKRRVGSTGEIRVGLPGSRTWGIVDSIVRLDRTQGSTSAAMISRLCSLG